jgi:hypothetical protein
MNGYQILEKLKVCIEQCEDWDCSIHQAGYKDVFFNLFREAHNQRFFEPSAHPQLTGDAIRDYLYENWLIEQNELNEKRANIMRTVLNMWDEWHYALKKYDIPSDDY